MEIFSILTQNSCLSKQMQKMPGELFLIKDHLNKLGFEKIDSVCVCLFVTLYIVSSVRIYQIFG